MKLAYFVPAYGSREHPCVGMARARECDWLRETLGWGVIDIFEDRLGIDMLRNWAIEHARNDLQCDYLYMQDADSWAEEPVLPRLLYGTEIKGATIAAAAVELRSASRTLNVYPSIPGERYEGKSAGSALMLIDLRKLNDIAKTYEGPWFSRSYADPRCTTLKTGGDMHFCDVVRAHGGTLWIDATRATVHAHIDTVGHRYQPASAAPAVTGASDDPAVTRIEESARG